MVKGKKMIQEKNIYKEVLIILAYFDEELIKKIPDKVFENLKELAGESEEDCYINTEQDLENQDISEESKDLIALIYYDYIADEQEKKEIMKLWNENERKYQEYLREKYNADNIFKNKRQEISMTENTSIIEYKKENIFYKIKNFIKKILKGY